MLGLLSSWVRSSLGTSFLKELCIERLIKMFHEWSVCLYGISSIKHQVFMTVMSFISPHNKTVILFFMTHCDFKSDSRSLLSGKLIFTILSTKLVSWWEAYSRLSYVKSGFKIFTIIKTVVYRAATVPVSIPIRNTSNFDFCKKENLPT